MPGLDDRAQVEENVGYRVNSKRAREKERNKESKWKRERERLRKKRVTV